jgi:energy-coupling factor transport system permease protein
MRFQGQRFKHLSAMVVNSPLRMIDPRTKMFISLAISMVVMLPLDRLVVFSTIYVLFLIWARLFIQAVRQIWRMRWILLFLFALDWWLISMDHGILVCTRLVLLTGTFTLLFSTTTHREFSLALEKLGVPYRYAFSLSLAFQSIDLLDDEWRAIQEAQRSRGVTQNVSTIRKLFSRIRDLMALTIPAIVLTTKRAWMITESAYSRGFDSPNRQSYRILKFQWMDGVLSVGFVALIVYLFWSM